MSNRKRIVIDARESGESTGRYVDELIRYLHVVQPKHEVVILTRAKRVEFMKRIAPSFTVIETEFKEFTFAEQLGFRKQIQNLKADLVHFPAAQQPAWYRGETVTTIQDLTTVYFRNPTKNWFIFTVKRWVYKWLIKRVVKKSSAVIAISQYVKDDVVRFTGADPTKITVTYEAADEFEDAPEPVPGFEGKRYIMFNGRSLPHKNHRRIIEAFAKLAPKYPDLYLMLAGKKNASHDTFLALARQFGVGERVILTDWITDGQLKWAMQHTQAYIWASLSEGFGLPPLEAMLYGAPVVSSNASCMPEILGEAAHYFNPLDIEDMAAKISEVLDNQRLRQKLITKGKAQTKKYSWQRMAEQTLAVYKQVLGED